VRDATRGRGGARARVNQRTKEDGQLSRARIIASCLSHCLSLPVPSSLTTIRRLTRRKKNYTLAPPELSIGLIAQPDKSYDP